MHSCAEVCEPIELSFGVMSEVGPGIDIRNGGPRGSRGSGGFWGCLAPNFQEKCIRLVREKLRIFPYAQYIIGVYISLAFKYVLKFEADVWVYE